MKTCKTCSTEKPLSEFFKSAPRKDGYEHRCKECKTAVNSASYQRNKEEVKLRSIKRKYGLSKEDYYNLLANGCEACGAVDNLVVDHDHSCCKPGVTCGNCIRGALCRRCNIAEGLFKNDPENIKNLLVYIQKHGII